MPTRRIFLKSSALAMVGVGAAPVWLSRAVFAKDAPGARKKILIAIFQRGAVDGLNMVMPHADPGYYALRPSLAIPRPEWKRFFGDRSRRPFRAASGPAGPEAALGRQAARDYRSRRFARSLALPLRCARLHGIRHARP